MNEIDVTNKTFINENILSHYKTAMLIYRQINNQPATI